MFNLQKGIAQGIKALSVLSTIDELYPGLIDLPAFGQNFVKLTGALGEINETGFGEQLGLNATDSDASLALQTEFGGIGGFDKIGDF